MLNTVLLALPSLIPPILVSDPVVFFAILSPAPSVEAIISIVFVVDEKVDTAALIPFVKL